MRLATAAVLGGVMAIATLAARPAQAWELYAGAGVGATQKPREFRDMAILLQAGVDDIVKGLGVGGHGRFTTGGPGAALEVRYSLFKIPLLRAFVGASVGLDGLTTQLSGRYGAFAGARLSLGLPFVGAQVGANYATGKITPEGLVSVGLCF